MSDIGDTTAAVWCIDVQSADRTSLAVWVDGDGPALVLVPGSLCEHSRFEPLVQELRNDMTTCAMDRRGYGASGDTAPYAIEREFEDVAAVVDAVAAQVGGPVALWGHSYGANPAIGGVALSSNVHRLIVYEPSFGLTYPAGAIEMIEAAVAAGDLEAAIHAGLVGPGAVTDEEFEALRQSERWPTIVALAPMLARECRAEQDWTYLPGRFASISAPALLLTGSETDPRIAELTQLAAAAIPDSRIRVLEGHGHFAFDTDPAMVAGIIREFVAT